MDRITIIEGDDLQYLLRSLGIDPGVVYRVRVWQSDDGRAKFKINEGTWTPPIGEAQ